MKHRLKVKGGQVITLQMTQLLKTQNINVIPGQLFCHQCKEKFLLKTKVDCIDDKDKVLSVTDNCHFACQFTRSTSAQPNN